MLVLLAACLAGCSKQSAVEYDNFESQLLSDCLDSLANHSPDRTLKALERLRDARVSERFSNFAIEHEKLRLLVHEVNAALAAGDFDEAEQRVRTVGNTGSETEVVRQIKQLLAALHALQAYRNADPENASSTAFAERLDILSPHIETLSASPGFSRFLIGEHARLETIKRQERERLLRSLLLDLDRTILASPRRAELMVAELAAIDPDHTLLAMRQAALARDWRKLAGIAREESVPGGGNRCLEMVLCLYWQQLPEQARRILVTGVSSDTSGSLSGLLLQARHAARAGRYTEAVGTLRELGAITPLSQDITANLIREAGYASKDFEAAQWRTPCPNVTDILLQMADARGKSLQK